MDAGLRTGTFWSGVGHAGAILWVLLGDWLFVPHPEVEINATQVSMISGAEFAALMASSPAPAVSDPAAEAPAPGEPPAPEQSPNPPARPEAPPAATLPEAAPPEPAPGPAAEPSVPAPEEPPSSDLAPAPEPPPPDEVALAPMDQPLPAMTTSPQPRPRPAERIAPAPDETPLPAPAETPRPAISDEVADEAPPVQEPAAEAVPEDAGDILRTEATQEQDQALGMTSSPAPRARPADLARTAAAAAAAAATEAAAPAASSSTSAGNAASVAEEDAIAAAIASAAASGSQAAPSPASPGSSVSGPPLNAGEIGDIRAAIAGKWNLGSVSSEVLRTVIVVRVEFGPDGKPGAITLVEKDGPSADAIDVAFAAARRAIQRAYVEGGIPLPPDKYDTWKVMEFVFDANGMRMR